jgi:hypothetical protein
VFADREAFAPVDAPQLLKHLLAAKRVAQEFDCSVIVLYAWWQPSGAGQYEIFQQHADSVARLAAALPDIDVTLYPLSYTELWTYWAGLGDTELVRHVTCLRDRYDVSLSA